MSDLDPFVITGFTVVANSGGKTSGFNLHLHLEANDGTLTEQGRCVFTNTGWEHALTLDFLAEQERRWQVAIDWLEFTRRAATPEELEWLEKKALKAIDRLARLRSEPPSCFAPKRKAAGVLVERHPEDLKSEAIIKANKYSLDCWHSFRKAALIGVDSYRKVNRQTARTDGGPMEELLEGLLKFRNEVKGQPGVLPNGVQRICTGHLKVKTTARYVSELWGIKRNEFSVQLGLRADEEERVKSAETWDNEGGCPRFPLYEAGITKADVAEFWSKQPFGLSLKAHEGNCGGCYMKRRAALVNLIRRGFFDVGWWKGWEERTGQRFRQERSYRGLEIAAREEQDLFPIDDLDNAITCESGYCSN